jgi:SAM-dependent methyltransferase
MHDIPPSPWVQRFAPLIPLHGRVLDVAAGSGRHARLLAAIGYRVDAVDRDVQALEALNEVPEITTCVADLEGGTWPYAAGAFDGVVVTHYLHRALFASLLDALKPGGFLIYETFMVGNELLGRPSNPNFLLQPYELLDRVRPRLTVVAFEQGRVEQPKPAVVQRICAACEPHAASGFAALP